jgi:hypothetical protein
MGSNLCESCGITFCYNPRTKEGSCEVEGKKIIKKIKENKKGLPRECPVCGGEKIEYLEG